MTALIGSPLRGAYACRHRTAPVFEKTVTRSSMLRSARTAAAHRLGWHTSGVGALHEAEVQGKSEVQVRRKLRRGGKLWRLQWIEQEVAIQGLLLSLRARA